MVFLDLFPVGIWQFKTVTENGLWFARSNAFIISTGFQTFTWLRIIGGALFTLGGVVPLVWFVMRSRKGFTKIASNVSKQNIVDKDLIPSETDTLLVN
jgi:nitric oxide reductase subunit B